MCLFICYIILLPTSFVVINLILICLIHFFRETIQGREDFLSFVVSMRGQALQPYRISVFLSNIHDKWTVNFLNVTFSYSKTTQSGSFLTKKSALSVFFRHSFSFFLFAHNEGTALIYCDAWTMHGSVDGAMFQSVKSRGAQPAMWGN